MSVQDIDAAAWFSILHHGFAAQSFPLGGSANITVFKKYLLRAGYVNFPFGIRSEDDHARIMEPDTLEAIRLIGADLLRINWPQRFGGYAKLSSIRLPEASIFALNTWSEERLDSDLRYKIRRSKREGITLRPATVDDANFIFRMYLETVLRHGGNRRYTESYFHALCQTGTQQPGLVALIAEVPSGERCGFNISAYREGTAYYLHGGMDEKHAQYRPGFVLMGEAITRARNAGCHEFNFMPSPADQPSLVQFKKKWGAMVYEINHFDIPLNIKGQLMRAALHWRH
jgi:hypothetical protein